jgi:hypothetical protein
MAGTPTSRYDVANLDQWGLLIKSWATHLDYISQSASPQPPRDYWVNDTWPKTKVCKPAPATIPDTDANGNPKPWCLPKGGSVDVTNEAGGTTKLPFAVAMSVDQFSKRVEAAGVYISNMPTQYKNVIIVQGKGDTMVMRLPPQDQLQSSEDDLLNGSAYALRPFYWALFGTSPDMPVGEASIMELHANRIGEYTLNNCT